jgi:CDP-glucose 4,6-dehydratase
MESKFWKDKSVLITGFEGFLGSNLSKALIFSGARLFGLDIRVGRKETILSKLDYKKIKVIKGSVASYKLVEKVINEYKINVVFHLAAEAIVGQCQKDPLKTFSANIEGTWNVLEACRNSKSIQAILIASSDKAYGAHKSLPYKEDAPLQGNHPYDVSKSCADLIANTYFNTYGLPVAITRCGNIYGPGDFNFSRLIPDAMRSLALNKILKIRSDGNFIRDYVYIDDIVAGYIRIAELFKEHSLSGEAFNLSDEKPVSVIKLLNKINRINFCDKSLKYRIMNIAKYEIKEQYLSSAKAQRILAWKPAYSLCDGLRKSAEWYFSYFSKR